MADFLLAAWLAWMTPSLTALSSCRAAWRMAVCAVSRSPASAASRKRRIAVLSDDLTLLLRNRAFSFVRIRLIWDLMFATKEASKLSGMDGAVRCCRRPGDIRTPMARGQPCQVTKAAGERPNPGAHGRVRSHGNRRQPPRTVTSSNLV